MAYKVGDRVEWIENVQELKVGTIARVMDGQIVEPCYDIYSDDKHYLVPVSKITQKFPPEPKYKAGDLVRFGLPQDIKRLGVLTMVSFYSGKNCFCKIMCREGTFLCFQDEIIEKLGDVWSCIEELEYDFKPCKCCEKKYIPMGDNRPGSITEVDKNGRPIEFEI